MKPMLFNTEMVRAILEGRKTVTRRVVKPQPKGQLIPELPSSCWAGYFREEGTQRVVRPPYFIGDILYVRETFFKDNAGKYHYKADDNLVFFEKDVGNGLGWQIIQWRPSIHMPKEAARLFLRARDVRTEKLQKMGMEDATKEGIIPAHRPGGCRCQFYFDGCMEGPCENRTACEIWQHTAPFIKIWNRTIKPAERIVYGWEANPDVWVIEFERISKEEAMKGEEA